MDRRHAHRSRARHPVHARAGGRPRGRQRPAGLSAARWASTRRASGRRKGSQRPWPTRIRTTDEAAAEGGRGMGADQQGMEGMTSARSRSTRWPDEPRRARSSPTRTRSCCWTRGSDCGRRDCRRRAAPPARRARRRSCACFEIHVDALPAVAAAAAQRGGDSHRRARRRRSMRPSRPSRRRARSPARRR